MEIDSEGRIFLVQPFAQPNGQVVERPIFTAQVTKAGQVFTDRDEKGSPVVLDRVRKFPIKAGRSEVRNEKEPNEPQPSGRLRSRSLLGFTREGEQRNKEEDMKRIALTLVVLAANLLPAVAQKIGTETSDRTRIVHLKTALNHLTVIEVGEPVVEVAAGSPSLKVEWRENKVFVQPTDADAASNLFIWTATQRLNYELEPAGPVESMDFAVDQAPARTAEPVKPANTSSQAPASPPFTELLFAGRPIRMLPSKQRASKPVEVWISDLYEKDGRLLIRYAVCNHGAQPYNIDTPQVYQLDGVRSPQSLYGFVNWQLGDEQVGKLKIKQEIPMKVLDGRLQSERIAPGEEVVGVVALQVASNPNPTILRLQFPDLDRSGGALNESQHTQIAAFLVR